MFRSVTPKPLLNIITWLCVSDMKACYGELNVSFDSAASPTETGSQNSITVLAGNSTKGKKTCIPDFTLRNRCAMYYLVQVRSKSHFYQNVVQDTN